MKHRMLVIAEWLLILGMFMIGALVVSRLPADSQIVVHWDANGNPNGWMRPLSGLMLIPVTALILMASKYLRNLPLRRDEAHANHVPSAKVSSLLPILGVMGAAEIVIAWSALGHVVDAALYVSIALGAFFILLGATFRRISFGLVVAVKTPFTLQQELADGQKDLPIRAVFIGCGIGIILSGIFMTGILRSSGLIIFSVAVPSIALIIHFLRGRTRRKLL